MCVCKGNFSQCVFPVSCIRLQNERAPKFRMGTEMYACHCHCLPGSRQRSLGPGAEPPHAGILEVSVCGWTTMEGSPLVTEQATRGDPCSPPSL